jgi:hypothetical protein
MSSLRCAAIAMLSDCRALPSHRTAAPLVAVKQSQRLKHTTLLHVHSGRPRSGKERPGVHGKHMQVR